MKLEQAARNIPAIIIPNELLHRQYHSWPNVYPHWWEEDGEEITDEIFAQFTPEVSEWCLDTFGFNRMPRLRWSDNSDYDRESFWVAWFSNETDMIAFKLRWNDGPA